MALQADQILSAVSDQLGPAWAIMAPWLKLFFWAGLGLYFLIILRKYDIKVVVYEMSKGNRVIAYHTIAAKIRTKDGTPKLKFFSWTGALGFNTEQINEPPSECMYANRSRLQPRQYNFVKKDGLYHPVNNHIQGIKYKDEQGIPLYSLEGSGLEINRDYDSEQAIGNKLLEKANAYRNKKPTEIIASFAFMIITIIVAGVIMIYTLNQMGELSTAISSLREPLKEGIMGAAQSIIGPG